MLIRLLRQLRSSALGRRNSSLQSAWQIIGWWEARRVLFNLIVGATGVVSSIGILLTALISEQLLAEPIGMPDPPVLVVVAVVFYVLGANVCYTGGWIGELVVKRAWPDESEQFGTLMFTLGLVFAVAVTLSPAVLISGVAVVVGVAPALGFGGAVE
jgi:hypothetical protein